MALLEKFGKRLVDKVSNIGMVYLRAERERLG